MEKNTMVNLNQALPDWSLQTIFGDEVPSLHSFQGRPLVVLFFSLGCPGCLGRAIPYANRLVYENDEAIHVIGVHSDFHHTGFSKEQFEKAKEEFFIRFPFYEDTNFDDTFKRYQAGGTPHWLVIDSDGRLIYSLFGSDPNNALLKLDYKISELLEKQ